MVSVGHQRGTRSRPVFQYLPGQLEYLPQYAQTWKDIFAGNMSSPTAQALQTAIGEAGMREAAQQRRQVSETRGLSTAAKQRLVGGMTEGVTKTMAGVPQEMFSMAAEWLGAYTLMPPAVGQYTSGGGGTSVGICSCDNMRALNEGELLEVLRHFRDSHFAPLSDIDIGYKAMSEWFVPFVKSNKGAMWLGRKLLLIPLSKVAQWVEGDEPTGFLYLPFAYFWVWFWKLYGRVTRKKFTEKTPRYHRYYYPLMSRTFLIRFREVI